VRRRGSPGRAVQVDPRKPTLKAPGTSRLKLKYYELLSSFDLNFNLRRYTEAAAAASDEWEVKALALSEQKDAALAAAQAALAEVQASSAATAAAAAAAREAGPGKRCSPRRMMTFD